MVRKLLVLIIILSFYDLLHSQNDSIYSSDDEMIFALETWPIHKGGVDGLNKFIKSNINYPKQDLFDTIGSVVFVEFWVDTLGKTTDHKVIRGIRKDLDNEALRVARLIKYDKPAMQRGKPIMVRYTIPVDFRIPDNRKRTRKNKNQ